MPTQAATAVTSLLTLGAIEAYAAAPDAGNADLYFCVAGAVAGAFMWSRQRDDTDRRGTLLERGAMFVAVLASGACLAPMVTHYVSGYVGADGPAVPLASGWLSGLVAHSLASNLLSSTRDRWAAWFVELLERLGKGGGR